MEELTFFNYNKTPLKIDKPIRLIELFSGIGAQAKALERLGADFEHHRTSEWEVSAVASYKAIHKYEDDTDYSKPFSNEELLDILCNLGISTDGKKPMTRAQISRKNEQWKRTVYNNFKATNNIGSIMNISGADLGIVDTDKYCYIMTYSFPCQDLSLAGKQKGMAKGSNTRSGLLWEVERLLNECDELPQVLLMENVTQVHGTKNKEHFEEWIEFLESLGYSNYWEDLNSKNFGIPQNRDRTFVVSVLGDYTYEFPQGFPLQLRLKHLLEDCVDEKYYISDKGIEYIVKRKGKYTQLCDRSTKIAKSAITAVGNANWTGNFIKESAINGDISKTIRAGGRGSVDRHSWDLVAEPAAYDEQNGYIRKDGIVGTLTTDGSSPKHNNRVLEPTTKENHGTITAIAENRVIVREATSEGYAEAIEGDSINLEHPNSKTRRGRVGHGVAQTLTTTPQQAVFEPVRIRKLTPRECWRLMGFYDEDFNKAAEVNSDSQLYKQAGNSIVVDVLAHIFTQML